MDTKSIKDHIKKLQDEGKKLFATSSFQSHSLVLVHILSKIDQEIPIYFLNTGYHFPETISFKEKIKEDFGIRVINIKSDTPRYMQMDSNHKLLFTIDPDYCCYLNKTQPTEKLLNQYDIWINGVRADQSKFRKSMNVYERTPFRAMRFHPMLDWNSKMIYDYIKQHNLPKHPMESKGYLSIGCEPCTRKIDPEMQEREARWYGMNKVECGLHTDLVKK